MATTQKRMAHASTLDVLYPMLATSTQPPIRMTAVVNTNLASDAQTMMLATSMRQQPGMMVHVICQKRVMIVKAIA
jgi:multisubunit Na+/H+ antiporter MnhE subunit